MSITSLEKRLFSERQTKTGKFKKKRKCDVCGQEWYPRLQFGSIVCPRCGKML